ncbi:hypothetical protein O6H91_19G009900 [Diphasiastrum complanatum]|uniref:Uncharacterized protein n=2 Tax=Diphasiastrum complanatum TaxID=34168 RepID=A0ACC2ASL6_DIPCM|nr:hypothetical protein O6H91_19G009800 [Diphasiastrum complanatum]KAJ7520535.1 hypothetical protein O6H91_19G009900 [Diphasiastrum complanatum]
MIKLVELRVPMYCEACEKSVRKALSRMIGVESVDVDMKQQRVTVMGYVDREKVLKKVRRTMKLAEVWPFRYQHHHHHHSHNYSKHYESEHWPHHHHEDAVEFWPSNHKSISDSYATHPIT